MQSIDDKRFFDRLSGLIGGNAAAAAISAMKEEASVSVRLNPSKPVPSRLPILKDSERVPWSEYGYILSERPVFTLHPLFHAGAYYVQDSSAMFVGWLFREALKHFDLSRPLRVLDLCAAPGGKTTDLAASLRAVCGDSFLLVSNEVMRQRASVLSDNVALWGDPNVLVCSQDPKAFSGFEGFFDIILADVPCSGEGMFRKDPKAVEDWSEELVELCSQRQRRILADVWPALRKGGMLVYSTCTFEDAENDSNLEWAATELGGDIVPPENPFGIRTTRCGHLLVPGEVPGEGQWAGCLVKTSGEERELPQSHGASMEMLKRLRPLRLGVSKGEFKGKDFVPDPDWALSISYERGSYPEVELDKQTALRFLHRDSISLPEAPLGYILVTYRSIALGFVKNIGRRCNNLHPQSRRIRMDI